MNKFGTILFYLTLIFAIASIVVSYSIINNIMPGPLGGEMGGKGMLIIFMPFAIFLPWIPIACILLLGKLIFQKEKTKRDKIMMVVCVFIIIWMLWLITQAMPFWKNMINSGFTRF